MNVYLDTNAVTKPYHKEVGSDELLAFLRYYADDLILIVADITRTEFHSAFLRRVRYPVTHLLVMPLAVNDMITCHYVKLFHKNVIIYSDVDAQNRYSAIKILTSFLSNIYTSLKMFCRHRE